MMEYLNQRIFKYSVQSEDKYYVNSYYCEFPKLRPYLIRNETKLQTWHTITIKYMHLTTCQIKQD